MLESIPKVSAIECDEIVKSVRDKLEGEHGSEWHAALRQILLSETPSQEGVHDNFNKYDLIVGVSVEYLDLGAQEETREAIEEIRKLGYRPANDLEVLMHHIKHPKQLTRNLKIVILGSVWFFPASSRKYSLVLSNSKEQCKLDLRMQMLAWDKDCRFAAVKIQE
jgi:hypothetical protein